MGAGCAGWAAAEAVRALDAHVPITMISACAGDRYHKPELSIALSRGATPDKLVREKAADAALRLGIRLLNDTVVVGLSPGLHQIRTTRGSFRYTGLVLAQGARPAVPAVLPADLCWRINDLASWSGLSQRLRGPVKHVAIVGAGMVGCELAEDFARSGHQVSLLDTQAAPLASLLPPAAAERLKHSLENLGVRFLGAVQVAAVTRGENGRKQIVTACGQILEADEVVAATGLVTDSRIARIAGLAYERGVVVDPATLRSSAPDVYALGDCISLNGMPCRFIEPIAHQASVLARGVLGLAAHEGYRHRPPVIRLKTRLLPVVIEGLPVAGGEWRVISEDADFLAMEQWSAGSLQARLNVGTPRRQLAA
ncbi:FAD-dependent oxidoreductase [Zoogloea sp.]|uniref:FAD-dependent oxidoreductase n=1 Tax=Zoogloea sp. TaxID=49181 RepID=UPI00261F6BA6|nr:FAD-dependent oxidoreductase [Zoogloea sp.]